MILEANLQVKNERLFAKNPIKHSLVSPYNPTANI